MVKPRFTAIAFIVLMAALHTGCGDTLPDQDYAGDALYTWTGNMFVQPRPRTNRGRLALFWWDIRQEGFVILTTEEIDITVTDGFPVFYTARLFQPPPDEAFYTTDQGVRIATGLIGLYIDSDENERYDPQTDELIGGNSSFAITYASDAVTEDDFSLLLGQLDSGYQVASVLDDNCLPGRVAQDTIPNDEAFVFAALDRRRSRERTIDLVVRARVDDFPGDIYECPLDDR